MRQVRVPAARWARWHENFVASHGPSRHELDGGVLVGTASDGSTFRVSLPFGAAVPAPDPGGLADLAESAVPDDWGVLLVRRGGFAVARLAGGRLEASKVGRRHVQGRTAAGGQSQQRFARRRAGQARVAFEAAADHAARLLAGVGPVVTGGDRGALSAVLEDPRLAPLAVVDDWLDVPDPRRDVLERAVADARALRVEVVNTPR